MRLTYRKQCLASRYIALHVLTTRHLTILLNRALQMLAAIESRLEELFETIESLPPEKVEVAEKVQLRGPGYQDWK